MSSIKKDGAKRKAATSTKVVRDDSTDRKPVRKLEDPVKSRSKQIVKPTAQSRTIKKPPEVVPKRKVPGTPTSTRVSKTQFFPGKSLYSNALKNQESVANSTRKPIATPNKSTKTETPSKGKSETPKKYGSVMDEVRKRKLKPKVEVQTDTSPDSSTLSERPRTATLRKGSIVNANIVGPGIPTDVASRNVKEILESKSPDNADHDYEEDFDSYESDFEACSTTSSSSGTARDVANISGEETSSVSSDGAPRHLSSNEEKKLDSGNFDLPEFKHKQILGNIKEYVERENANLSKGNNNPASLSDEGFEDQRSLQFINFLDAKKKHERRKSAETRLRRGRQILSMIRLDAVSFTLLDLPPVPYDVFIRSYGGNDRVQVASQTGEDNVDEEVQTEEISTESKWTQLPTTFTPFTDWLAYQQDYHGVSDPDRSTPDLTSYNEESLKRSLVSSGGLILRLLEEEEQRLTHPFRKDVRGIPFSDGYVEFDLASGDLRDTTLLSVSFSCDSSDKLLSVHSGRGMFDVVAVWSVFDLEKPVMVLRSHGSISCCFFSVEFVYAGMYDGTVSIWDPKQSFPVITTSIGSGHLTKVVGVQPLKEEPNQNLSKEVCTLDEDGDLILWSVIARNDLTEVVLVINTRVSLRAIHEGLGDLQCTDFVLSPIDTNYAFVATNYGFVVHHFVKGGKEGVKKFSPAQFSTVNRLDPCPFDADYFLAGHASGDLHLYSVSTERPLMTLSDKETGIQGAGVDLVQWSKYKPFVIYTKDESNTVHLWDLNESDMFPVCSIPFEEEVTCMKLSPGFLEEESKRSYMVIGTRDGRLYLHQLNKDHGRQSREVFDEHVATFKNYVSRL